MTLCGAQCQQCNQQNICQGCKATGGQPFGKPCFIARYIQLGGTEAFKAFKAQLITEINQLNIPGMPQVTQLAALNGRLVNLPYPLPSGQKVTFLEDDQVYLGTQLPCEWDESVLFGVIAGMDFIMVCQCDAQWANPELILYKKR